MGAALEVRGQAEWPEEFSWLDANYDHDSALGRELLFLIADNRWVRATSETIDIARSDAVDTTVKIDVDLDRITHEVFRGRAGQLWLPVLVLPPLQQRLPEPDPFSTLAVADANGHPLAALPNADVRHRIAAALTEIILNVEASLPDAENRAFSATRDHRLLLSAAMPRVQAATTQASPPWNSPRRSPPCSARAPAGNRSPSLSSGTSRKRTGTAPPMT